jgi:hypothetical protein
MFSPAPTGMVETLPLSILTPASLAKFAIDLPMVIPCLMIGGFSFDTRPYEFIEI